MPTVWGSMISLQEIRTLVMVRQLPHTLDTLFLASEFDWAKVVTETNQGAHDDGGKVTCGRGCVYHGSVKGKHVCSSPKELLETSTGLEMRKHFLQEPWYSSAVLQLTVANAMTKVRHTSMHADDGTSATLIVYERRAHTAQRHPTHPLPLSVTVGVRRSCRRWFVPGAFGCYDISRIL